MQPAYSASEEYAVSCRELTKKYPPNVVAVNAVNCHIPYHSLFGIIGPDGAGKSSWLKMIATLSNPTAGTLSVLGLDPVHEFRKLRKVIGYMPGKFSLYGDLSVRENLNFFASVYGTSVEENYTFIEEIYSRLAPFSKRPAAKLSGGMKQKLALCCALIHKPELLILDEPTTGVDPVSRQEFWQILRKLRDQNTMTIVVSTPYMDEATRCDRVALMSEGKILDQDSPQGLIDSFSEPLWAVKANDMGALLKALRSMKGIRSSFSFGESNHITFDEALLSPDSIREELRLQGFSDFSIERIRPSIEDFYLLASDLTPTLTDVNNTPL